MSTQKKNILICLNDSKAAKNVVELAKQHAKAFDADVHIITSFNQSRDVKEKDADKMLKADSLLDKIKQEFIDIGITCSTRLIVNEASPGENILQYAGNNAIDEIIIGVERTSKVGKMIFGSTAQFVIIGAACPVLCTK
jgi:nucleotide-binding universal stress UspA family protein